MILLSLHIVIVATCIALILLRRHRQPESRVAWLLVIFALPYLGALAYLLLGDTNVGRRRVARLQRTLLALPRPESAPDWPPAAIAEPYAALFKVGESVSGYAPVAGNHAQLMDDTDAAIDAMVADIDHAREQVHALFYIWLDDRNGRRFAEALMRAARRGVTCRAMVDDLGSRALLRSALWRELRAAGVLTATALQIGHPLLRVFQGRLDLRNHRKIVVIDNRITYCGSQNCADAAFLPKAKYAPWVDAVMRFEGPVARQNQHLFATDWAGNGGDNLASVLCQPLPDIGPGFVAQVIGTGPTFRNSAMPEVFETLIYAARRELFITTPYYVPNAAIQAALVACANRAVDTTLVLPARNDDFAVGATSRSYYEELLTAGVRIHEFQPGLLHAKTLTLDGEITLIGSANLDRRSFDLNYENNILLHDVETTRQLRARQAAYLAESRPVTLAEVGRWSLGRRLWNNTMAILSPVL